MGKEPLALFLGDHQHHALVAGDGGFLSYGFVADPQGKAVGDGQCFSCVMQSLQADACRIGDGKHRYVVGVILRKANTVICGKRAHGDAVTHKLVGNVLFRQ